MIFIVYLSEFEFKLQSRIYGKIERKALMKPIFCTVLFGNLQMFDSRDASAASIVSLAASYDA